MENPGLVDSSGILGLAAGLPIIGIWIFRQIMRLKSRDQVELTKDRVETDLIKMIQDDDDRIRKENERLITRLDKISEERNLSVQQLGRFTAEGEMNKVRIEELQQSIHIMSTKVDEQSKLLQEVLLENVYLKSRITHLEYLNGQLESEIQALATRLDASGHR